MRWISDWRGAVLMLALLVGIPIVVINTFGMLAGAGSVFAVAILLGLVLD